MWNLHTGRTCTHLKGSKIVQYDFWILESTHTHYGGYSDLLIIGDLIGLLRPEWCTPRAKPKVNIASLGSLKQLETCLSMITVSVSVSLVDNAGPQISALEATPSRQFQ